MNALEMTEPQIRSRASMLGLKARGCSEAWLDGQIRAGISKIGKKRPEQADIMRMINAKKKPLTQDKKTLIGQKTKQRIAKNGHPRGMLGLRHSESAKEKMSIAGLARWAGESEEVKTDRIVKSMKTRAVNGTVHNMNRANASWKSGWREIGGKRKYFRSRWEANYARYLEFLKLKNEIKEWEHEPETFWFEGIKRGCMSYLPDFKIINNDGTTEYHEVKGWMDDRSKTKIKRMAKYHPAIKLLLIDCTVYKSIQDKLSSLIYDWE